MKKIIDTAAYPVKDLLPILLQDKTTKKNIIWATCDYAAYGPEFSDRHEITTAALNGVNSFLLQPRVSKSFEEQQGRTRKKAEVMTPVWLCNKMNNFADEQWFGRRDVFNHENENNTWTVILPKVEFGNLSWKKYVDSRRLEITCGEAPYLVSRYDTTTGELIAPPILRIGMLDRKLRVVSENTESEDEWLLWAKRAVQSSYGYEYQGDNLLIARINVLLSYCEHYSERWGKNPELSVLKEIANIISWNLWQMDGLKNTVPLGKPYEAEHQMTLFEFEEPNEEDDEQEALSCKIFDWRANESRTFESYKEKGK